MAIWTHINCSLRLRRLDQTKDKLLKHDIFKRNGMSLFVNKDEKDRIGLQIIGDVRHCRDEERVVNLFNLFCSDLGVIDGVLSVCTYYLIIYKYDFYNKNWLMMINE